MAEPKAKPARRLRGTGTFYKSPTTGRYVGYVNFPPGPDGRRRRRKAEANSAGDLYNKLEAIRRQGFETPPHRGRPATGRTVADWVDHWSETALSESVANGKRTISTEKNYNETLEYYVKPIIGHIRLDDLTGPDVDVMLAELRERGLSKDTRRLARTVLGLALKLAEHQSVVPKNVVATTDSPGRTKRMDPLTAAEAKAVLSTAAAQADRWEALAVLVLKMGLRQAEALDLRWEHLHLDDGWAHVPGTKTEHSDRDIPLPAPVVAALKAHRHRQNVERAAAPSWRDPGLVFADTEGRRVMRRAVVEWWHDLTVAAGIGRRRFHATRHTAATLMLNNGVPLEVISKILGHASLSITSDLYAKPNVETMRKALDDAGWGQ